MDKYELKYNNMILSYKSIAKDLSDRKFGNWQSYIKKLLRSKTVLKQLKKKLRIEDISKYEKKKDYKAIYHMISDLTGFDVKKVYALTEQPDSDRDLMIAFAYSVGFDFSQSLEDFNAKNNPMKDNLDEFFDMAMMTHLDLKNIDDYIFVCANIMFDNALNSGQHISRKINIRSLQVLIKNQINSSLADPGQFNSWNTFYKYWFDRNNLSVDFMYSKTGIPKPEPDEVTKKKVGVFIRKWGEKIPTKYEYLYMICIMFRFNVLQTTAVFERYYNKRHTKNRRPNLNDQEDLQWLYIVENYWRLDELAFKRQSDPIQEYISDYLKASKKKKLTMLEYKALFRNLRFKTVNEGFSDTDGEETYTLSGVDSLIKKDLNPLTEKHFICLADEAKEPDPAALSNTQIAVGSSMDLLHATDPSRILLYWKKNQGESSDNSADDMIGQIFYNKDKSELDSYRQSASLLLRKWTGNNVVHSYLVNYVYYANIKGTFDAKHDHGKVNTYGSLISQLHNKTGDFPMRRDLIAIGIILSMPLKAINDLLEKCGYKQLNQRDYTECLLIMMLKDVEKNFRQCFGFKVSYERSPDSGEALNIGAIKKERTQYEGPRVQLQKYYPKWFKSDRYDAKVLPNEIEFEDGSFGKLEPRLIWKNRWSLRLHIRLCLLSAGLPKDNWLVDALRNNYFEENLKDFVEVR